MLDRVKRIVLLIGAVIMALILAYRSGRKDHAQDVQIDEYQRTIAATKDREKIDESVQKSDDLLERAGRAGVLRNK